MTLRGGKILEPALPKEQKKIRKVNNEEEDELEVEILSPKEKGETEKLEEANRDEGSKEPMAEIFPKNSTQPGPLVMPNYEPVPPFPEALKDTRKYERDADMYDMFSKCEVNLPLLDFLKSVPRSAKFLKELWSIKRKQ